MINFGNYHDHDGFLVSQVMMSMKDERDVVKKSATPRRNSTASILILHGRNRKALRTCHRQVYYNHETQLFRGYQPAGYDGYEIVG